MPKTSPCCGICVIDPVTKLCRGCARTLQEIAAWSSASVEEQEDIAYVAALRQKVIEYHPQT